VNSLAEPQRANEAFGGAVVKDWVVSVERFNAMEKEFKVYDLRGRCGTSRPDAHRGGET